MVRRRAPARATPLGDPTAGHPRHQRHSQPPHGEHPCFGDANGLHSATLEVEGVGHEPSQACRPAAIGQLIVPEVVPQHLFRKPGSEVTFGTVRPRKMTFSRPKGSNSVRPGSRPRRRGRVRRAGRGVARAAGECSTNTAVSRYTRHSAVRVRSARPGMFQIASPKSCCHG